jgi:ABC-type transport system substrate-binding protein
VVTQHATSKHLIWPVSRSGIEVGWDPDVQHLGPRRFAPYYTVHLPYEPLTTHLISTDEQGIRFPDGDKWQPRMAESWEGSDGDRTWTVHLRRGVMSNYGNELTSADVKWAWERTYALKGVGLWRSRRLAGLDSADSIDEVDRYTLRFRLAGPNPEFPGYLAFATNNVFDSVEAKKHSDANDPWATTWLETNIAGFGAFTVERHDDDSIVFNARSDYWAGRPGVDTVTQVAVDYREQGFRMLDSGDANMVLNLYPEELARYTGRPEFTMMRIRATHTTLEFNWLEPPFDDQNVRQAIAYAMPYQAVIDQVYNGYARPSKSPLSSVTKYYTDEFYHYRTDLAKAQELMKASAHPDGFQTVLYVGPTNESLRFGEILRTALKPLGIDVEVRFYTALPFGTKVPMWFKEECHHALYEPMYDLGHDYDPPIGMWGGRNLRERMWTERIRAVRQADASDQRRLYRELQRDLLEFAPCVHLAEPESGWVFRGEIDPWAFSADFLGANTTVWSAQRQIMPYW